MFVTRTMCNMINTKWCFCVTCIMCAMLLVRVFFTKCTMRTCSMCSISAVCIMYTMHATRTMSPVCTMCVSALCAM